MQTLIKILATALTSALSVAAGVLVWSLLGLSEDAFTLLVLALPQTYFYGALLGALIGGVGIIGSKYRKGDVKMVYLLIVAALTGLVAAYFLVNEPLLSFFLS